ncbi:MAG: hypothetical protein K6G85_02020 [Eubacterium sp.]|nr:hypothetical protein [Eubacterium sp.]
MEWIWLLMAGVLEVTWAVAMKASNGFKVFIFPIISVLQSRL